MSKPLVLVTGSNGQLGWSLQQLFEEYKSKFDFLFATREQLNLLQTEHIKQFIEELNPKFVINCAAYTAVDKAETEQEVALKVNAMAVAEIAKACATINATLITISTDYVFDGNGTTPYKINHITNPLNYYGYTKWLGEKLALENHSNTIIIRTSWVYGEHGHNFVKTMLKLLKEKEEINVVNDQTGCPTYAPDLAKAIMKIISLKPENKHTGIYHFSNTGNITWFKFASKIKEIAKLPCAINAVPSSAFPTPAKRPTYSVMDTTEITKDFEIEIAAWQTSLIQCITNLENLNKVN
jgi:dTDP-4-dehydrorhamnose reductase